VLLYGHLDKQPEMTGWREDLGPWKPVIENGRLYGRGAADDGYALYSALTVIQALDARKVARPRCVGLIETCEESGSPDLPDYLARLAPRFGQVQLVAGLDSGCGNYEQLWVTTSLRGLVGGVLTVEVLQEGVHSGNASGLVPSSFRIARKLLNRLDDVDTGRLLPEALHAPIPQERIEQAHAAGAILGDIVWKQFPWVGCNHGPDVHAHAMPTTTDPIEAILNRTWRPALSVTGAEHLPGIAADHQWQDPRIDRLFQRDIAHARERLAPSDDAIGRLQSHHQHVEGIGRAPAPAPGRGPRHGPR
jgi:acetylornithine deacetylase/succinyl-diaminopimelate desuccinylase-like protein